MAASVEGMFTIIDRASGPMKRMELQALATDRAIKKVGGDLDKNIGSPKQLQQLERMQRETRTLERDVSNLGGGGGGGRGLRGLGRDADNTGGKLERLLLKLVKFKALFAVTKLAAMGAAIGVVVQALGALAGGAAAMVPALVGAVGALGALLGPLASLGGVLAGLPALILGVVGAQQVLKLATKDVALALKGNQQALKRLTPEAKAFVRVLRNDYQPMLQRLRVTAQEGLFPGLLDTLKQLRVAFPYVNALVGDFAARIGGIAKQAAGRFTQTGFLQDFLSIGKQGGRVLTGLGGAAIDVISALRHIAVAAEPFTDWLTRTAERWAAFINAWALAGRRSGRFEQFFERSRKRLLLFFDIVKNLTRVLLGFTQAARPVGDSLFRSLDKATKRWADFMQSLEGQARVRAWLVRAERSFHLIWDILVQLARALVLLGRAGGASGNSLWRAADKALRRWNDWADTTKGQLALVRSFQDYVPAVRAIAGLFGDLGVAILQMGRDPVLAGMATNLGRLIPMLQTFLNQIVRQLGPPLIDLLLQVGTLLQTLTQAGGPLQIFLEILSRILRLVNKIVGAIPGLGMVLAAAFSVIMIQRFIAWIGRATVAMFGLRTAAAEAAIATNAAMGGAAAGGAAGAAARGATGLGTGALIGGRFGRTRMGRVLGESKLRFGLGRQVATTAAEAGELGLAARAGFLTRGLGLGRLAGLGRVAGPVGIGAAIAGLGLGLLPQGALPGNTSTGNKIKGVGGSVATGAALGAVAGSIVPGVGTAIGAGLGAAGGLGYGLAKNVFHPFGFGAPAPPDQFARIQRRLGRMGGDDPTRRQLANQVRYLSRLEKQYAADTSASGQIVHEQLKAELRVRRQVLTTQNQQLRAERQIRQERERARDVTRARAYGRALGVGFDVDTKNLGMTGAFEEIRKKFTKLASTLGPAGRKALARPLADWAEDLRRQGKAPKGEVDKLNAAIVASFAGVDQKVKVVNGRILTSSTRQWQGIKNALVTQANLARVGLKNSFDQIDQLARGKLSAMGYSGADINRILAGAASGRIGALGGGAGGGGGGGGAAGLAAAGVPTFVPGVGFSSPGQNVLTSATGGRIPGAGRLDTVPVGPGMMAAPNELIVNRHTERRVDRLLGLVGTSLGGEVAGETRRHSAPVVGYATGGRAGGTAASPLDGLQAGIRSVAGAVLARFPGLSVTSTTSGRHAKDSYHYRGMAVDLAAAPAVMDSAAAWIGGALGRRLLEGIHNPNLSIKNGAQVAPGFWGAKTWAEHLNHIHLAAGGEAGGARGNAALAMGGRRPRVRLVAPAVALGGVPGALQASGGRAYAYGLQKAINRRLAQSVAGLPSGGGGSNTANEQLAHRMMLRHGWGEGQWTALRALWQGESGFSSSARNAESGAFGIPQALPASKMGAAAVGGNAAAQIAWGLNYISGRYGSPSGAYSSWLSRNPHWYDRGGRAPDWGGWFAKGGTRTYSRPTVIGVGDSGKETVTMTPAGAPAGRRVTFSPTVTIHRIDYRGDGDVEEVVHRELGKAFDRFADDLAGVGVEVE